MRHLERLYTLSSVSPLLNALSRLASCNLFYRSVLILADSTVNLIIPLSSDSVKSYAWVGFGDIMTCPIPTRGNQRKIYAWCT